MAFFWAVQKQSNSGLGNGSGVQTPIDGGGVVPVPIPTPPQNVNPGQDVTPKRPIGGDRDEHGCLIGAGYTWCDASQKCFRPWEETCEVKQTDGTCHLQTCHGLDITCGTEEMRSCIMLYAVGDRCLQYAQCEMANGQCQQKQNSKFDSCKSCVQKCLSQYPNDGMKAMDCESSCG